MSQKILTCYLGIIIALVVLGQLTNLMVAPSLPALTLEFDTTTQFIQMAMSIGFLVYGVSQLIYGALADYRGRIYAGTLGLSLFAGGSILCSFATSDSFFACGRIVQGLGIGCVGVLSRALVSDVFSGKDLLKYMSYLGLGVVITPVIAPLVGGYIHEHLGWRVNFILLALIAGMCILMFTRVLHETLPEKKKMVLKTIAVDYRRFLLTPQFTGLCAVYMLSFSGLMYFSTVAPFLIQEQYGYSAQEYGQLIFLAVPFFIAGGKIVTFLAHKWPARRITLLGASVQFLSACALIVYASSDIQSLSGVMLPMAFYGLGVAIITPTTAAKYMQIFPKQAGSAGAVAGCLGMTGSGMVTFCMSYFCTQSELCLGTALCVICTLNLCILFCLWQRLRLLAQQQTCVS